MEPVFMDDVHQMVKTWVRQARADAKKNGEHPPPPLSRVPKELYQHLFREALYWHELAAGTFLDEVTKPQPATHHIAAIRQHLANCTDELHQMMTNRGNTLPAGTREQFAVIEQRIGAALDVVEHPDNTWGREAQHAWRELTWWAQKLHYGRASGAPAPWNPQRTRAKPLD